MPWPLASDVEDEIGHSGRARPASCFAILCICAQGSEGPSPHQQ
jgi:hypothetical protein